MNLTSEHNIPADITYVIETDEQEADFLNEDSSTIYPYNTTENDLDIREEKWSIFDFVRKMDKGVIIKDPDFQRNFVWEDKQKYEFIESIILGLPIPPFYLNVTAKGKFLIVDGRQRSTTIDSFLKNGFILKNLKAFPQLNGYNYEKLSNDERYSKFISRIEDKQLTLYLIQSSVLIKVVYDIFNRINTNGTPLNKQEVRNCIFAGKASKLLKKLSEDNKFLKAIDYGVSSRRMKDREYILRYLAFKYSDYFRDYKDEMGDFLDDFMKGLNNYSDESIKNIEEDFLRIMKWTFALFANNAFRIKQENSRGILNVAIMESICVALSNKSDEFIEKNKRTIIANYNRLLNNDTYIDAVRYSTNNRKKVLERFKLANEILFENCHD